MISRSKKPIIRAAWILAGLGVVAALAAGSFIREVLRSRQIDREIAALKAESERLQSRNFELLSRSADLDAPESLERQARVGFNLRRDGERVVVLGQAQPAASPLLEAPLAPWSNPQKWWTYFTDRRAYDERLAASRRPDPTP